MSSKNFSRYLADWNEKIKHYLDEMPGDWMEKIFFK